MRSQFAGQSFEGKMMAAVAKEGMNQAAGAMMGAVPNVARDAVKGARPWISEFLNGFSFPAGPGDIKDRVMTNSVLFMANYVLLVFLVLLGSLILNIPVLVGTSITLAILYGLVFTEFGGCSKWVRYLLAVPVLMTAVGSVLNFAHSMIWTASEFWLMLVVAHILFKEVEGSDSFKPIPVGV
eukprot:TRINITY_DN29133_c0_g1_i1.p1 TRINITY_DN29133_c0_g1~~TRINITY_DN29133_c0_g1_i1.p1  ORF type:complete len:182 (+),score=27.59 TRINITY_DN29133_c0_g1_i1:127-672(+)